MCKTTRWPTRCLALRRTEAEEEVVASAEGGVGVGAVAVSVLRGPTVWLLHPPLPCRADPDRPRERERESERESK